VLIRADCANGEQTEASVTTIGHTEAEHADLAWALMASLPGVERVRVWADGLSFLDAPTVDVSRFHMKVPPEIADAVQRVTALLRLGDDAPDGHRDTPA